MKIIYEHQYEQECGDMILSEEIALLHFEDGDMFATISKATITLEHKQKISEPNCDFVYIKNLPAFSEWLMEHSGFYREATKETMQNLITTIKAQLPFYHDLRLIKKGDKVRINKLEVEVQDIVKVNGQKMISTEYGEFAYDLAQKI